MKVIQIMDNLGVSGGVNSFVYDLCYELKIQGCDVSLIGILDSSDKDNEEVLKLRKSGIEVLCLGAKNKKDAILHYVKKLRYVIIQQSNGDKTICNLHLKLSVLLGGTATIGLKNIKCVETYHSRYSHYTFEYNLMKNRIAKYIPCSKSAGKEMQERFRTPDHKICTIPNGISCSEIRKVLPIESSTVTFLSVGRLTRQKNYTTIIDAFNKLKRSDIRYLVIGKGEDEEMLKNQITANCVRLIGTVDRKKVLSYTAGADMVCMPSLWEGLSIFMMEAFALGRPMMLSDIPSFREAVGECELGNDLYRKCEWGYLVKVDDSQAYVLAITDFLAHKENWGNMQKASLKISENFNIQKTAKNYIEIYTEVNNGV